MKAALFHPGLGYHIRFRENNFQGCQMTQENFCWSAIAAKDGRLQVVQLFMATEREKGNDFIYQNRGSASHISS